MTRTPSILTLAAGFALGAAAILYCRKAPRIQVAAPDWLSDYRKQADGTVTPDDLVDGIGEDSFPASDPPSFNGNRST